MNEKHINYVEGIVTKAQDGNAKVRLDSGTSSKQNAELTSMEYEPIRVATAKDGISLRLRHEGTDVPTDYDPIAWPEHYNAHPSGIEPISIARHMSFCLGNVIKYIMRADLKGKPIEDLKKAREYLNYEIQLREDKENGRR